MERAPRVTMQFPGEYKAMLDQLAKAMGKQPGEVAKEIVMETLDGMKEMFSDAQTSDQALRRMFKLSFVKMLDALEEVDKLPSK